MFDSEKNLLYERYRFFKRYQKKEESIFEYLEEIRHIAEGCEFDMLEESMIRDRLVFGITNRKVKAAILERGGDPSLTVITKILCKGKIGRKPKVQREETNYKTESELHIEEAIEEAIKNAAKKVDTHEEEYDNVVIKMEPMEIIESILTREDEDQQAIPSNTPPANRTELKCNICRKQFLTESKFHRHVTKHVQCEICQKHFTNVSSLNEHKLVHSNEKPEKCSVCDKGFKSKLHLNNHMRIHQPPENIPCPVCKKMFRRTDLIKQHMATEHPAPGPDGRIRIFECHLCKSKQKTKHRLRAHMKLSHSQKNWLCTQCGIGFTRKHKLDVHMMRDDHRVDGKILKPFKCDQCPKQFISHCRLVEHKRVHTGEKPFGCEECGKHFALAAALKLHKESHLGVKRHQCTVCEYKTNYKTNIKKHMKVHTGRT